MNIEKEKIKKQLDKVADAIAKPRGLWEVAVDTNYGFSKRVVVRQRKGCFLEMAETLFGKKRGHLIRRENESNYWLKSKTVDFNSMKTLVEDLRLVGLSDLMQDFCDASDEIEASKDYEEAKSDSLECDKILNDMIYVCHGSANAVWKYINKKDEEELDLVFNKIKKGFEEANKKYEKFLG